MNGIDKSTLAAFAITVGILAACVTIALIGD